MILIHLDQNVSAAPETESLIRQACEAALETEGVETFVSVHVMLTDDEEIREYNQQYRGIDRATDVLSFPASPFTPEHTAGSQPETLRKAYDPDDGACFLGDIIISIPHAEAQAAEYGHAVTREIAYLTTHAMFHLMGYDHMNEKDRKAMRNKEEEAISKFALSQEDEWMLQQAREAMSMSYSPYSHYAVGACLKCTDGTYYTGCNIENASFGATNCAERTAIFKAVSEGKRSFESIAIASAGSEAWPCGICRQVMYEFSPEMRVMITWDGHTAQALLRDLLPHGFGPKSLDA